MSKTILSKLISAFIAKTGRYSEFQQLWNNDQDEADNRVMIINANDVAEHIQKCEPQNGWTFPVDFKNLKPGLRQFCVSVSEDHQPPVPPSNGNVVFVTPDMLPMLFPSKGQSGLQPTYAPQEVPYYTLVSYDKLSIKAMLDWFTEDNIKQVAYELSEFYIDYSKSSPASPWYCNLTQKERIIADPLLGYCRLSGRPLKEVIMDYLHLSPAWGMTIYLFPDDANKPNDRPPVWETRLLLNKKGELLKFNGTDMITHHPTKELFIHEPFSDYGHPNAIDTQSLVDNMSYYIYPTLLTIQWINDGKIDFSIE